MMTKLTDLQKELIAASHGGCSGQFVRTAFNVKPWPGYIPPEADQHTVVIDELLPYFEVKPGQLWVIRGWWRTRTMIRQWTSCLFCGVTDDQTAEYQDEITRDLKGKGWRSVGGTASACPKCAKDKAETIGRINAEFNDAFAAEFKRSYEKLYGEAFSWPKVKGGAS